MQNIPKLLGVPLVIWGGVFLISGVIFQILSGLRLIKFNYKYHKWVGIAVLTIAIVHAILGISIFYSL